MAFGLLRQEISTSAGALTIWWRRRQLRKYCWHHDEGGNPANIYPAISWIEQQIIETGKAKMYWCTKCGKTWIP
jgi:hypothetical protein